MTLLKQLRMSFPSAHHLRLYQNLARYGLTKGYRDGSPAQGATFSSLRIALQESGDICSLFGLFLSTRIDLLSIEDCLDFAQIPDTGLPSPFAEVQQFVEQELGVSVDEAFLAVEPMPYETTLLHDSYLAMLNSGESVSLRVSRREFRSFPTEQLDALRMLSHCMLFPNRSDIDILDVVDGFAGELRSRMDRVETTAIFDALAVDVQAGDRLWVPAIWKQYCGHGVLVLERRPARKLSSVVNREKSVAFGTTDEHDLSPDRAARILSFAWLHQVFLGRVFPLEFGREDVSFLEDGRVGFLGRVFTSPSPDSSDVSAKLWSYLLAAAADNPDESCRTLLGLMTRTKESQPQEQLLAGFRQSVPCFMSAPGQPDFCGGLAARLLRYLQIATQAGYRPISSLTAFYRGLFALLTATYAIEPRGDLILEALERVWMMELIGSASKMLGRDALGEIGGQYLAAMMELPTRLDEVLSNHNNRDDAIDYASGELHDVDHSSLIAAVLVLTAVLLLVRSSLFHVAPVWIDRISFSIGCLIGLVVLHLAAHR